jgi:hypothetical protein
MTAVAADPRKVKKLHDDMRLQGIPDDDVTRSAFWSSFPPSLPRSRARALSLSRSITLPVPPFPFPSRPFFLAF